jgi:DNA-binding CsgD family transcriptional regulator
MTPRELQAARLVCKGFNNSEIAKILNIKYGTVKVHLRNIYRKVRVGSKISLLLKFVEDVNGFYAMSESVSHLPVPITESVPQASSDILYESPIKNEV